MKCCGQLPVILLVSVFATVPVWGGSAGDSGYRFSINGRAVTPQHYPLNGDPSVCMPGDVIYVGDKEFDYGGLYMTLGEERDCRFVAASARMGVSESSGAAPRRSPRDSRVFLELPDGRHKVVGLKVSWTVRQEPIDPKEQAQGKNREAKKQPSSDRIPYNPLDSMSPEEIHELWGIAFVQWPDGVERELAHVNTDRVCLTVDDRAGVGGRAGSFFGGPAFPPIPPKTRYLVVEESVSPGLRDFSHFGQFHDLLFLKFRSFPSEPLDAGLICQNTSMRYLDLSGCGIPNYPKLASLTELRFLNISGCRDIKDVEFVKGMRQLRTLLLGRTQASSLSPLDGSDSIREIHAGMTGVRVLPKGDLNSLRVINLVSSKVDAQAVEQFREDHPACAVQYGWVDSLHQAVQGTTRLRVRSGGTCHRRIEEEKTLAEITDTAEINRLVSRILIDESRSGGACMCCGYPTFEFYAGDRLLAMVGYHHGERLRWADGKWTGDGELTGPSADFLNSWLSRHGMDGPQREVEARQRQQDEEVRRQTRYAELIPRPTLVAVMEAQSSGEISWRDDTLGEKRKKLVADAFQKHEQDAEASITLYLRILGVTGNEPWNSYEYFDSVIVKHLLPRFKGPTLARAAQDVMKDEEGAMGAARWFFADDGWRNLDEPDRERILPPLARRAVQHRYMNTRKQVMYVLSEIRSPWAAEPLHRMLSWPTDPKWSPPKVRYGWRIDLAGGGQVCADECSEAVWAAFCLAKMGDRGSLPAIQRLADEYRGPDKGLLNKALQLLQAKEGKTPADTK